MFEATDEDLLGQFRISSNLNREALKSLPAVFVQETDGNTGAPAHVGVIHAIQSAGNNTWIEYSFDQQIPPIPTQVLKSISEQLDIKPYELLRTHWAVKEVDIFKVLLKNYPVTLPSPKVFSLANVGIQRRNLLSAMMPFDAKFGPVHLAIQKAAQASGMECKRADDLWVHDAIIQDVVSLINQSRIVVCDCTGRNPNVFYEAGIAHTLGRDVILITQQKEDVPFDLRHLRFLPYLNNGEGLDLLTSNLIGRIQTLLSGC